MIGTARVEDRMYLAMREQTVNLAALFPAGNANKESQGATGSVNSASDEGQTELPFSDPIEF